MLTGIGNYNNLFYLILSLTIVIHMSAVETIISCAFFLNYITKNIYLITFLLQIIKLPLKW